MQGLNYCLTSPEITDSTLLWNEKIAWLHKNFSQSAATRQSANTVFKAINKEIRVRDDRSTAVLRYMNFDFFSQDELLKLSESALRYRLFQLEKKLENVESLHTERMLIDEKYRVEYMLRRK